jgi:S-adenosylmethionine-diacylglycerol 3-amino-3-carboxypropyl transferase
MKINYAQCWEDHAVLRRALAVGPTDDVLSVASGGDNSMALLLDNPRSVTAIDRNPAQIYLVELKIAALRTLDYDDFVTFLGALPCPHRTRLYRTVRTRLSPQAAEFWDARPAHLAAGVIHRGKFERYLEMFRRFILPLIQSRESISAFLESSSLAEQARYYRQRIDSRRWRLLFQLVFSRPMLTRFGRCREAFAQVGSTLIASELLRRTARGLTSVSVGNNYIVRYALTGAYGLERCAPAYLQPGNFYCLRERIDRLRLVQGDLAEHLNGATAGAYSAFNLSDVFEYMDGEQVAAFTQTLNRVSRDDGRAAFWTMFNQQDVPIDCRTHVTLDALISESLSRKDKGFFYGSFHLWRIRDAVGRFDRFCARSVGTAGFL